MRWVILVGPVKKTHIMVANDLRRKGDNFHDMTPPVLMEASARFINCEMGTKYTPESLNGIERKPRETWRPNESTPCQSWSKASKPV